MMTPSSLQAEAWAAWNASHGEPLGDAYRTLGAVLYRLDLQERIGALLARSDEQNARLDALPVSSLGSGAERMNRMA
jgi:hypothetical protein